MTVRKIHMIAKIKMKKKKVNKTKVKIKQVKKIREPAKMKNLRKMEKVIILKIFMMYLQIKNIDDINHNSV